MFASESESICLRAKSLEGKQQRLVWCSIPDDHISLRRSALFMARSVLRNIREGVRAAIQASDAAASVLAERFGNEAENHLIPAVQFSRTTSMGTLARKQAGSLAGFVPYSRESGQWKGKSFGGKMIPRIIFCSALSHALAVSRSFRISATMVTS